MKQVYLCISGDQELLDASPGGEAGLATTDHQPPGPLQRHASWQVDKQLEIKMGQGRAGWMAHVIGKESAPVQTLVGHLVTIL